MPTRTSLGQAEVGVEVQARHVKRVQWVLEQVWTEFYNNKPKINLDITRDKSLYIEAAATPTQESSKLYPPAQLRQKYADYVKAVPKLLTSVGPDKLGSTSDVQFKSNGKGRMSFLQPDSKPPRTGSFGPNTTGPPYSFCTPVENLTRVWHDYTLSYLPMLKDDLTVEQYEKTAKSMLHDKYGLDPDYDIIVFETATRLKAEGMTDLENDSTHVFPVRCNEILFYDTTRKMPAFPVISRHGEKEWKSRPAKSDPLPHGREGHDASEVWCPRLECGFDCHRHIQDAKHEFTVLRRPAMTAPHTTLVIPKKPCSDKCVFHLDKRELEISDTQDKPRTPFSKDRLSALLSHLPGLEQQGKSYCDAAEVLSGPTCQDVALELKVWKTRIMLQEDSKPILDDTGEILQPAADTVRDAVNQPDLPIDYRTPSLAYCTHLGPCGADCPCSIRQSACERTCHCTFECPRRWKGCRCRSDPTNPSKKCIPGKCPCQLQNRQCDPGLCRCQAKQIGFPPLKGPRCQNIDTGKSDRPGALVRVSKISDAGYGLFATEAIKKGRLIGEYTGEVLDANEVDRRQYIYEDVKRNYVYDLGSDAGVYFDAFNSGNIIRFINGTIASKANVIAELPNVSGEPRVLIRALKQIKKGEEMFLDYGVDFKGGGRSAPKKLTQGEQVKQGEQVTQTRPKQIKIKVNKPSRGTGIPGQADMPKASGSGSVLRSKENNDNSKKRRLE